MSTVSDMLKGLRQVVLMEANIARLERSVESLSNDVDGLADGLGALRDRVSRLEGFIEGAAAVSQSQPRLMRD